MSYPPVSNVPDEHHYPPSTADWVTSPLAAEDELPHNPLEQADTSAPGRRLGAVLVIVGGLLAIAGSVMQGQRCSSLPPGICGWSWSPVVWPLRRPGEASVRSCVRLRKGADESFGLRLLP